MPGLSKPKQRECTIQYAEELSPNSTAKSLTFYPTTEQIENFSLLIKTIEDETRAGSKCGIIKIIPPEGWKPRKQQYTNKLIGQTVISKPVTETFSSGAKNMCYTKDVSVYKNQTTWIDLQNYAKKNKLQGVKGKSRDEIDKLMWECMKKSMTEQLPDPVYGADTEGTLYDDKIPHLNISNLRTILDDLKSTKMPGVTTTYLYFGMWRTMFPWHSEDVDLYSINYLHHGHAKHWWSIPPEAADMFERTLSQLFPDDARKCKAFLRHKNFIVHPTLLTLNGVPFSMTTQNKGEFIITFPRGYHMGYNTGLNIAESTNFASDRWVDFGMNYVMCQCKKDAVTINVNSFVEKYRDSDHYKKWILYWHSVKNDTARVTAIAKGKEYSLNCNDWMLSRNEPNLYEEREYNRERSHHFPHCAVCEAFLPPECCVNVGSVPSKSRRFLNCALFTKRNEENIFDSMEELEKKREDKWAKEQEEKKENEGRAITPDPPSYDPPEDHLLVCDNCKVSVHENCYARRWQYDRRVDRNAPWRCVRCCEHDIRLRTATCVLCELRGGALVRATIGTTPTFAHVVCVLAHRRAFFMEESAEYRNHVYIYPPPKYNDDDALLRKLSEPEYLNVSRPWDSIANRYECQICSAHGEGLLVCTLCELEVEEDADADIVHATCARRVGMRLERRTFPLLIVLYCHKHKGRARLEIGTEVEVEDGRRGRIVGYVEEKCEKEEDEENEENVLSTRCVVEFENCEISEDTLESDIVDCWCPDRDVDDRRKHKHIVNSPITVRWLNDDKLYPAYYRGPAPPSKYKIQFGGGGDVEIVNKDEVEEPDVAVPVPFLPPAKKKKLTRKRGQWL